MPKNFLEKQVLIDSEWQNFILSSESLKQWLNEAKTLPLFNWSYYKKLRGDFNNHYLMHVKRVEKLCLKKSKTPNEINYGNEHLRLIAPQYHAILRELILLEPIPPIVKQEELETTDATHLKQVVDVLPKAIPPSSQKNDSSATAIIKPIFKLTHRQKPDASLTNKQKELIAASLFSTSPNTTTNSLPASHRSSSTSTFKQRFFPLPEAEEQELSGEIFPYSPDIYEKDRY